ncbi:MAG: S8 family serine peptidase [Thaumarchaeota archaeon]|nr:S8 family serine peptidase [Nitrososphaerota archaeon]
MRPPGSTGRDSCKVRGDKRPAYPPAYAAAVVTSAVIAAALAIAVLASSGSTHDGDDGIRTYLERSVPFVGGDVPRLDGVGGEGILIAVIDTGVDYEHPDMLGWRGDGKVAGGYNFLWGDDGDAPLDTDGHGTQVAGVASADGSLRGVAPESRILAYKVSEDGSNVSSELIARAVTRAVEDGADVINISMGVSTKNSVIEDAINEALGRGALVVVAAGNDGPGTSTIGSPGRSSGSLTVGATYNNLTSSLVATLDVAGAFSYTVIPMVGSESLAEPIDAGLVSAGYAKESDFEDVDAGGAIVIAERGSDVEGELLYFSLKESHAADAGAAALIVYNNVDGMFLGELAHEFAEPGYEPRIPVVSMEREEGLELLELLANGTASDALLHLFHNPDFVAHFSSRGPVMPFFIKPDVVAPGAYINTTQAGSVYEIMSGTSYAAPHASGAAALLLEKNPGLDRHELKSIIMNTADPVMDAYGQELSVHETGSGRLNITRAYGADIAVLPPSFVLATSEKDRASEVVLELRSVRLAASYDAAAATDDDGGSSGIGANDIKRAPLEAGLVGVRFEGPSFVDFSHSIEAGSVLARMTVAYNDTGAAGGAGPAPAPLGHGPYGEHEGRVVVTYNGSEYAVPFLLHHTRGSVDATVSYSDLRDANAAGRLDLAVSHPDGWEFVKIDVIDSVSEESVSVTATPADGSSPSLEVLQNGTYWIDARITSGNGTYAAYDMIRVGPHDEPGAPAPDHPSSDSPQRVAFSPSESLPVRQIAIIAAAVAVIGALGVAFRTRGGQNR